MHQGTHFDFRFAHGYNVVHKDLLCPVGHQGRLTHIGPRTGLQISDENCDQFLVLHVQLQTGMSQIKLRVTRQVEAMFNIGSNAKDDRFALALDQRDRLSFMRTVNDFQGDTNSTLVIFWFVVSCPGFGIQFVFVFPFHGVIIIVVGAGMKVILIELLILIDDRMEVIIIVIVVVVNINDFLPLGTSTSLLLGRSSLLSTRRP
mmetsp:Transcript_1969/g.3065  ORF Transcript_1969/g.3065 Transcript_1969/m.3065 type:complete len:203 (-) Transcript_1969:1154-1762(-)